MKTIIIIAVIIVGIYFLVSAILKTGGSNDNINVAGAWVGLAMVYQFFDNGRYNYTNYSADHTTNGRYAVSGNHIKLLSGIWDRTFLISADGNSITDIENEVVQISWNK